MRTVRIEAGGIAGIDAQAGQRFRVVGGEVWVTQPEDGRDWVLKTGQELRVHGRGRVVAYAFEPSVVEVEDVEPASLAGAAAITACLMGLLA